MKPGSRVRLADVAARAGVSVATVSKVVNGRYGVAKDTYDRVQAVIDELDYVGNLSASSLRSARTNVLGILVAGFEPYSAELIKGMALASEGRGYELLAHAGGETHGWEKRALARMGGTLMDGAVIVTPTVLEATTSVPVVAIDPHYGPNVLPTIDSDGYGGAVQATEYLLSLGHRRIAFLGGREELDSSRERERGYRKAMADAGVAVRQDYVRESRYHESVAAEQTGQLLELDVPPTAIIAANDVTAIAAMTAAQQRGLTVPGDISFIGFDDVPEASLSQPRLTTVRQPLKDIGHAAMSMLLDLINGVERESHIRMATTLVVRDSCGPVTH